MTTRTSCLLATVVFAGVVVPWTTNRAAPPAGGARAEIAALMIERVEVLAKRVEAVKMQYEVGAVDLESVLDAQEDLDQAQLPLAETQAARLAIHQSRLQSAKQLEAVMQQRARDGIVNMADVYLATAARLQAEIDLLREQSSE